MSEMVLPRYAIKRAIFFFLIAGLIPDSIIVSRFLAVSRVTFCVAACSFCFRLVLCRASAQVARGMSLGRIWGCGGKGNVGVSVGIDACDRIHGYRAVKRPSMFT